MARNRKTRAEREQERIDAEQRAWEEFRPKLSALQSYIEAKMLVAQAPRPDSPGRRYYSNLAFFLQDFTVPTDSSSAEKSLYLQLIQRMDSARALKPGVGQKVKEELQRAMRARGNR